MHSGMDKEDYLIHINKMKESETLTTYIGIGIPPIKLKNSKSVEEVVVAIKKELPQSVKLHGFVFTSDLFIYSP
jgi:hypothetical protein